jgi:hypothetical protein
MNGKDTWTTPTLEQLVVSAETLGGGSVVD